jgi:N-acetyl-alpha-D-muramate 1-phosphate uridylyltransferase
VMYGDSYLDVDFTDVLAAFRGSPALGLMTVFRNENRHDRSNVSFCDGVLRAYDKRHPTGDMTHIDYGLSLLRAAVLGEVRAGEAADLGEVYHELVVRGAMDGFEVRRRFYEIGSPEGLAETRKFLAR